MNNNSNHKDNESMETFVQNDVFKELELAEKAVTDIYKFKEDFRVKTVYESFGGLYKFGDKFKFILSFLTASLATIGLFFLFYFDTFDGFINYVLIGLAAIFGLSVAIGLEFTKYVISPIVAKSWLRDKKVQKALLLTSIVIMCASVVSTVYGTYKIIELYYVPVLADVDSVGAEQSSDIADYQTKIAEAKADKAKIDKQRDKYHKRTGKPSGWIEHEVYNELTTNISDYEAEIRNLRGQIRADKKETKSDNQTTEIEHATNKYAFVWVGGIVAFLCELGLAIVLFLLQKYKYSTLKQIDTIQNPIATVLNIVSNPLTELKSSLLGGNNLVVSANQNVQPIPQNTGSNVPPMVTNQTSNVSPLNINPTSNVPPIVANSGGVQVGANVGDLQGNYSASTSYTNSLYTGGQNRRTAGFKIGANNGTNLTPKNKPKPLNTQTVKTNELSKIELKIMHYTAKVRESENRLKTLKQKAAIEKAKTALKNRQRNLQYWQKKKAEYQGKVIA